MFRRLPCRVFRRSQLANLRTGCSVRAQPVLTWDMAAAFEANTRNAAVKSGESQSPRMYDSAAPIEPPIAMDR